MMLWAASIVGTAAATVLAQTENPIAEGLGYGALGLIAGLFIVGRIVPSSSVDKAEARADRAEAKAETMLDDYRTVVEALHRATAAIQTADQARTVQAERDAEMRVLLDQVRTALERQRG